MFGRIYTTEDRMPSLEESGRKRLYDPSLAPCAELRRLNKELLRLFMKLVRDLCEPLPPDAPEQPHLDLVKEIEDTFVNMQHLVNVMRPAQAALDLKTILGRQTAARKEMTEKLNESIKKSWELIGDAATKLSEPSVELTEQSKETLDAAGNATNAQSNGKVNVREDGARPDMAEMLAKIAQVVQDPSL